MVKAKLIAGVWLISLFVEDVMSSHFSRRGVRALLAISLAGMILTAAPLMADNPRGFGAQDSKPNLGGPARSTQGPQPGQPGVKPTFTPATIPSVSEYPVIERDALLKKLDVSYRRAFLGEIVGDLARRTGLRAVYPASIERSFMVTLEAKDLTVPQILEKVATQAKLKLDYKPDLLIISQPADDVSFNKLVAQLKDKDRWVRCTAVADLASLGDARVAWALVSVLKDSDPGVRAWAIFLLQDHACFLPSLSADDATALTDELKGAIARIKPNAHPGPLADQLFVDMKLLAALRSDRAQQAIIGFLDDANDNDTRYMAALYLPDSGYDDSFKILSQYYSKVKEWVDQDAADHKDDKNRSFNMNDVPYKQRVLLAAIWAGIKECPSVQSQQLLQSDAPMELFGGYKPGGATRQALTHGFPFGAYSADLEINLRLTPAQVAEYAAFVKNAAEKWSDATTQPAEWKQMDSYNLLTALNALSYVDNGGADDAVAKIAANPAILEKLSVWVNQNQQIGAYSNGIVDGLTASLQKTDSSETKQFIMASLGTSHLPAAADTLIKSLSESDPLVRAAAARGLAHTRDSRAVDAITACLRTPAEKLPWPDLEGQAQKELKAGHAIRMVPNPLRSVAYAIAETRDPKALDALLALGKDASIGADARTDSLEALPNTALDLTTIDSYVQQVSKLDAGAQRSALQLNAARNGVFQWSNLVPSTESDQLWCDPRVIDLLIAHGLDPECFVVFNDVRNSSKVVDRLYRAMHPLDEKALLKLAQSDADEHLTYFAGRALKQYSDPNVDVKMEK